MKIAKVARPVRRDEDLVIYPGDSGTGTGDAAPITRSQIRLAFRELGASLSKRRRTLEFTQAELGAQVGYSRSTVAGAETGYGRAHHDFWQACDRKLGAGGELLAVYLRVHGLMRALDEQVKRESQWRRSQRLRGLQADTHGVIPAEPAAGRNGCDCPALGQVPMVTVTVIAGAAGSVHVLIEPTTPQGSGLAGSVPPDGARVYSLAQTRYNGATRTG